jgi:DinB superfamily
MASESTFAAVAADLLRNIDAALPKLQSIADADAVRPLTSDHWSAKQVIGHLIDSAANNHQRFVRAQQGPLTFPPYTPDHWVDCQHYQDRAWVDLVDLWDAYNRHLAHVIKQIPEERRNVPCTVEDAAPVTLGFLATDYVVHLRHHLAQLGALG